METAGLAVGVVAGLVGWTFALPWLVPTSEKKKRLVRSKEHPKIHGLSVAYEPDSPEIDICFIHGLTGDAQSTWTAHNTDTKEDIFWPTKYLADQTLSDGTRFPKARILLFGYETEINSLCWLTERTLYHHGHHLLKSLTKLREKCKHRPLLFVAHSLGGLLVKSALIFASDIGNSTVTEEREIYHSTIGIVSFGTPQIFAGNAPLTDMIARLCQLPDHIPQFEDYGSTGWQSDVKTLQTRLNKYKPIAKEIPEVFCYESISNTRSLEQTVPSPFRKGAVHDLCVAVPIDADHADLCKFRTRSREFRKIRNSIQVFYDKSHAVLRRRRTGPLETPNSITSLSSIISRRKFTLKPSLPSRVDFVSGKGPKSRESLLAELENQLTRIRRAVLTGSPGNGKTTLASEFAHRSQEGRTKVQTSSVLWLDAGSDHALQASFMKIFWKLREYCFPYDDAQPINSGQVTENPGQPKERRQPGKDIDQPGKEDTYYALRQALDSVQENDDGIPRTEEDRRFVMRFILDWLYFPGNETWLLVYDDVEDSEAPYLQDYLPQKADRGYVIFTSRRDHKNPLELRDGEIELGPFRRVQSDSSSTAGNGPGYGSHEAATHPTAQDRSFVPPGYEQEPYYRDEPSFFGPDSPPESTPVTVERSLKFPPIRVGSFDREESLKYMETVYDHSQPLSVGNELSRRQTFNEVAEKYCDNPSDITYRIGSAFDESSADPVQQVEKDLRSGDHYEEIPAGYAEWVNCSVMLGCEPIPFLLIKAGFSQDEEQISRGLAELQSAGWAWLSQNTKTFRVPETHRRLRRQELEASGRAAVSADVACKSMVTALRSINSSEARTIAGSRSWRSSQEQHLLKHIDACLDNYAKWGAFADCQWDILAGFSEKHGLYSEAARFYGAAGGQDIPNSDTQSLMSDSYLTVDPSVARRDSRHDAESLRSFDSILEVTTPDPEPPSPDSLGKDTKNSRKLRSELGLVRMQIMLGQFEDVDDHCLRILERVQDRREKPYLRLKRDVLKQIVNIKIAYEDWPSAVQSSHQLIETLEQSFGPSADDTLKAVHQLARMHMDQGDFAGATPLLEQVLMYRQMDSLDSSNLKIIDVYEDLARTYREQGDLKKAQGWYEKIIDMLRDILGEEHIRTAKIKESLAIVHNVLGDYDFSDFLYKEALHAAKQLGTESKDYTDMKRNYSVLLQKRERDRRRNEKRHDSDIAYPH